jgi:hypothetical protein
MSGVDTTAGEIGVGQLFAFDGFIFVGGPFVDGNRLAHKIAKIDALDNSYRYDEIPVFDVPIPSGKPVKRLSSV